MSCVGGQPGPDGTLCPYRENAPQTEAGWQAWDVLLRCAGQLRLAPSGYPLGMDLTAAFAVGEALGYDAQGLAEFLPVLEAGLVTGLKIEIDRLRSDP